MVMGCVPFAPILRNWKMYKHICTQLASHSQANQTVEVKKTSHVILSRKNSLRMGTSLTLPRDMGSAENFPKNRSSSRIFRGLGQLAECLSCMHEVMYSIPALAKTKVIWFEWIIENFSHVFFRSFSHHFRSSEYYSHILWKVPPPSLCLPLCLWFIHEEGIQLFTGYVLCDFPHSPACALVQVSSSHKEWICVSDEY